MTTNQALAGWLATPGSYSHRPDRIEVIETHISWVFLTGEFAFKLKKPVQFDFLDFRSIEIRRQACEEEVRLNSRLAAGVYLGVLPIYLDRSGEFSWAVVGEPVDYVVKMVQLSGDATLEQHINAGVASVSQLDQLACVLSSFYECAERPHIEPNTYREDLRTHIQANRQQLLERANSLISPCIRRVHTAQLAMLALHPQIFDTRVMAGRVVDGHGDLRPEHIYFTPAPKIIDCIEFNAEFRRIDVADELAFLYVECDRLGTGEIGRQIQERVGRDLKDEVADELLAFYKTYRACVRAKVLSLRSQQVTGNKPCESQRLADQYLELAEKYAEPLPSGLLIVVGGLMGTGKSTLANALADSLGIEVLSTDRIRREIFGPSSSPAAYGEGNYGAKNRDRVYQELFSQAEVFLRSGQSVILDGTFLSEFAHTGAGKCGRLAKQIAFVRCTCPDEVAELRIAERRARGESLSEARGELYKLQKKELANRADAAWAKVETTTSLGEQVEQALQALSPCC